MNSQKTIQARTIELSGTSYEIGRQLGEVVGNIPPLMARHTVGMVGFGAAEMGEAMALFARWCHGLDEELQGFADALGVAPEKVLYYGMTSLRPRCSQVAVLPSMTKEARPLVVRSYEFNEKMEDFCLVCTSVAGNFRAFSNISLKSVRSSIRPI